MISFPLIGANIFKFNSHLNIRIQGTDEWISNVFQQFTSRKKYFQLLANVKTSQRSVILLMLSYSLSFFFSSYFSLWLKVLCYFLANETQSHVNKCCWLRKMILASKKILLEVQCTWFLQLRISFFDYMLRTKIKFLCTTREKNDFILFLVCVFIAARGHKPFFFQILKIAWQFWQSSIFFMMNKWNYIFSL